MFTLAVQRHIGYPFHAGHFIDSSTYRESLMALPRPRQILDLR